MSEDDTEHAKEVLQDRETVAYNSEFDIIHGPDTEHGGQHPEVKTVTLDAEKCFACRQCFGYPGTTDELDALLSEDTPDLSDGQQSLAGWSA